MQSMHVNLPKPIFDRYIAFIAIVVIGSALALVLANPAQVRREDGSPVSIEVSADWAEEIRALGRLLKKKSVWLMGS